MTISGQLFVPAQYATFQAFENDDTVNANQLSFIEETKDIYLGRSLYSGAIEILESAESFPAQTSARIGVLYCNPSTMEIRRYTNTSYDVLVRPVSNTVESEDHSPVTGNAVYSYVQSAAADLQTAISDKMDKVTGSSGKLPQLNGTGGLTATSINVAEVVVDSDIQKLIKSVSENSGTWTITYFDGTQSTFQTAVTDYLQQVAFDHETGALTFHFKTSNGNENIVTADLSSLVDIYTGLSGYYIPDAQVYVRENPASMESFNSGSYIKLNSNVYKALQNSVRAEDYQNTTKWAEQFVASAVTDVWNGTNQLYLNQGIYYKVPANTTGDPLATLADGALHQRSIDVTISGYMIEATPVLAPDGNIVETSKGLDVKTAFEVTSNLLIPRNTAIINYVASSAIKKGTWTQAGFAVKTNTSGGIDVTPYQYGSGLLGANPSSNTLATEAAVQSAVDNAEQNLESLITALNDSKMNKVDGVANKLLLSDGSGGFLITEKSIGNATISTSPSANVLATEAAVVAKINEITSGAITVWK